MTLSNNWFCEGRIDFEMKQYMLLAYLQKVDKLFKEKKLYSSLTDLIKHYTNVLSFNREAVLIESNFHKEIRAMDLETKKLMFDQNEKKQAEIDELKEIVAFAMERFSEMVMYGQAMYDDTARNINFFEVGVISLQQQTGHLIIQHLEDFYVYSYKVSPIIFEKERHQGLNLKLLYSVPKSFVNTFENIKLSLLKENPTCVYGTHFHQVSYPYQETILPVVKREFLVHLKKAEKKATA
jgi:hypothetical protein